MCQHVNAVTANDAPDITINKLHPVSKFLTENKALKAAYYIENKALKVACYI